MSSIKDKTLGEFSNLSYTDLDPKLIEDLDIGVEVTLKDHADICIDYYLEREKSGNLSYQEQDILNVLKKCQSGEYKDYKIKKYENGNNKTGFVGYAIETKPGELIITSRGSEVPGEETDKGWEDWIDNVQISTKYETDQQKAAKDFLNEVGLEYDSIYLTGHSKGGNNAIYATIAANSDIRSKIEDCVTFNAPGFSDKFIKDQKYVIEQLNKRGIFREYQGSSDLVSSIMNNVSIPLIISQRDLDKSSLERLKAFDDHYIYAMEVDGDAFILDNDGKKAFIPILVNNLVAGLTQTLTDKEIDEIISLAYNIINKDEDAGAADIYKMILNSGVDISTVNIILLQVITEANITYLKESPNGFVTRIGYIAELYRDTRIFIYSNISRTKNYIVDGLLKLGESIEKLGLSNMRDILNIGFKLSIGSIFTRKISPIIADLNSSGIISNKCLVTVDDINTSLRGYKAELINIREYFKNIDVAIKKLVELGWSGNASQSFYLAKFTDVKSSMDTIESQLRYMVRYLEKAKNGFESIELEEDALVGILD